MRPKASTRMVVALCLAILSGLFSAEGATANRSKRQQPTPGVELAKTVSLVTGVAISPLLGVSAVGAYQWYNAPKEKRPGLPWYGQPWFWVPGLLIVTIIGIKDILGTAAPSALKKPFDVAETIENKISGLIAAGAFVPLIISIFPEAANDEAVLRLSPLGAGFAAIDPGSIGNAFLVPLALAIFVVVWLASHAINILILLSPFTTLDTALKAFRLSLLAFVSGSSMINPWVGAAIASVVILTAYFLAGWSFRMSVLGTVYLWDILTFRRYRFQPGAESNKLFTARKIENAKTRTYGRLIREKDGETVFDYRPWLILPRERFVLHQGEYVVGRGIFYPEIARLEGDKLITIFILPPRYYGHEEAVARAYGLSGVRDVGIRRGLKAGWRWLKGLFRGGTILDIQPANPEKQAA